MDTSKIVPLVSLLSSDQDGEVLGAVRAIGRVLKSQGKDWHDFAALISKPADHSPQQESPPWDDFEQPAEKKRKTPKKSPVSHHVRIVMRCKEIMRDNRGRGCTGKELSFLESMLDWTGEPTERQWDWLDAIAHKLGFDPEDV